MAQETTPKADPFSPRPELEKMTKLKPKSDIIADFLDWMRSENKPMPDTDLECTKVMAEYFEIDLDKVEREKSKLLEEIREQNAKP